MELIRAPVGRQAERSEEGRVQRQDSQKGTREYDGEEDEELEALLKRAKNKEVSSKNYQKKLKLPKVLLFSH
jgi:hypothetical protein